MIILRVKCTCDRNLLDVRWIAVAQSQHEDMGRPGWLDVRPRPNVDWRPEQNTRTPGKLDEWTHDVGCLCGEHWTLSERRLASAWLRHVDDPPRVVRVVLGADV